MVERLACSSDHWSYAGWGFKLLAGSANLDRSRVMRQTKQSLVPQVGLTHPTLEKSTGYISIDELETKYDFFFNGLYSLKKQEA